MRNYKTLALAGAVALTTFAAGSASAALNTTGGIVDDTSAIAVTNVANSSDTFKACKIADVTYDSATNTVAYQFTTAFTTWQSGLANDNAFKNLDMETYMGNNYSNHTNGGSPVTGSNLIDQLAGALAADSTFTGSCTSMTTSGTSATATVPAGAYLIVPHTTSGNTAYGAMIANIGVKSENGDYVLDTTNASIAAKSSSPAASTKTTSKDNSAKDSFAIGEEYQYVVTANAPAYPSNASNKKFGVTDTLENGVTFVSYGNIVSGGNTYTVDTSSSCNGGYCIKSGNTTVGYVTESGSTRTFMFDDITVTPAPITINYTAKLNSNATLGNKIGADSVNENSASILTPQDFYNASAQMNQSTPVVAPVYTFGIRIKKIGGGDSSNLLSGAEFNLCPDATCNTPINSSAIVTGNGGIATYVSVGEGTYYLKETKAPNGYKLAGDTTVTIARASSPNDGYFEYEINDPVAQFNLPFTGGRGVALYAILGVGIVSIASVYYVRKKQQA